MSDRMLRLNEMKAGLNRVIMISLMALSLPSGLFAQDTIPKNLHANGYLTNMQSYMFRSWKGDWIADNLIHNRLNFRWQNNRNTFNAALEIRNRFISGETVKGFPGYDRVVEGDNGFVGLSKNISKGYSYILNSKIDRLYFDYTLNKFQVRVGRQRINWGQCYTWNPNDLFNTYSFFDFDYVEKPGCDALRLMYYPNATSGIELAFKADSAHKITTAFFYHFNKWNYDIQFLGGIYNDNDFVIGTGWSGNIKDASFRGEISYFRPGDHFSDTTGTLVFSLGSEYTFRNSLTIQSELLYNQMNSRYTGNFSDLYNMGLSAKNLSFTPLSFMIQASYPVTPLFNATLSMMYFPKINGYFAGPSIDYSISDNISLSVLLQTFGGQLQQSSTEHYNLVFARLKWNF
jgi:hypothetical protein